jgi:heme exporter protein C
MAIKKARWEFALLAVALLTWGGWWGLFHAPPDRYMGDVQRIFYVHVPSVWMMLIALTANFGLSVTYLLTNRINVDAWAESTAEVGLVFGALGLTLGSIWARPTWGVWWTWDPRLTTVFVLLVTYAGYLALRRFIDNPERRAVMSSVSGILAGAGIPLIWFSVKYFNSIHQPQSSPSTVDPAMHWPLRISAFGFLSAMIWFLQLRHQIAVARLNRELAVPEALPLSKQVAR